MGLNLLVDIVQIQMLVVYGYSAFVCERGFPVCMKPLLRWLKRCSVFAYFVQRANQTVNISAKGHFWNCKNALPGHFRGKH